MRSSLIVLVWVAACSEPTQTPPARDARPLPPKAAPVDAAPVTWTGPNLYTLDEGEVVAAITLTPPRWAERDIDSFGIVSPAGSTMSAWLERGPAAAAPTRGDRSYRHEHAVPVAGDPWRVVCDVALVEADAAIFDELVRQCAELPMQYEPDARPSWKLTVTPARAKLAGLDQVVVRYAVTNRGVEPINARAYSLEWFVDGEPSMALGMAFGNGGFENKWLALPPGDTVDDAREGVAITDAPGEHVITLVHLGRELGRVTLKVTK
jgi:hypothetical protein